MGFLTVFVLEGDDALLGVSGVNTAIQVPAQFACEAAGNALVVVEQTDAVISAEDDVVVDRFDILDLNKKKGTYT